MSALSLGQAQSGPIPEQIGIPRSLVSVTPDFVQQRKLRVGTMLDVLMHGKPSVPVYNAVLLCIPYIFLL